VQGRASCPSTKNDPTAEKLPNRLETKPPLKYATTALNIGRTLFVEGHKALPCTDTNAAGESCDYLF